MEGAVQAALWKLVTPVQITDLSNSLNLLPVQWIYVRTTRGRSEMGNPVSAVIVNLYMEIFEEEPIAGLAS